MEHKKILTIPTLEPVLHAAARVLLLPHSEDHTMTQHISHPDIQPTKQPSPTKSAAPHAAPERERAKQPLRDGVKQERREREKQEVREHDQERRAQAFENARERPRDTPWPGPREPSQISLDRAADEGMTAPPDEDEN